MNRSLIHNGIVVTADVSGAVSGLEQLMNTQHKLLHDSKIFAQQMPSQWNNAFTAPIKKFRQSLNTVYGDIQKYNYEVRKLANNMNSVVMAGVAVSMTGVGIKQAGQKINRFFGSALQNARDFERAMLDIKFLGGLDELEMAKIEKKVVEVGMSSPTTNLKVAEGMIQAMRAGFSSTEAEALAKPIADLVFMSMNKLDETRAVKFINDFLKTTEQSVDNIDVIIDKIAKTTANFPTDIEGLWRTWQSSAAAFDNLGLGRQEKGDSTFLTLLGGMTTTFNERRAGMALNSLGRGLLQASQSEGKRGEIFNSFGIDLDGEKDLLDTLYEIYDNGLEKYGKRGEDFLKEGHEFHGKLLRAFGLEALPVFQMIEKYRRQGISLHDIRDNIHNSDGSYSDEYMKMMMGTFFGTQKIFAGIRETLSTLIGMSILRPINMLLQGLNSILQRVTVFAQNNPGIVKFISLFVLLGGAVAIALGSVLLFAGGIMAMVGSIGSGITSLASLAGATHFAANAGIKTGASIADVWRGVITPPIRSTIRTIGRFTAMSTLAYLAWKHDLAGIRTHVNRVITSFSEANRYASRMFEQGSGLTLDIFMDDLKEIRKTDPLKAWFIEKSAMAKGLGMLIRGLWKDNVIMADDVGGEAELRRLIELWEYLGLFPIAETILGWRDNINAFFRGFKEGLESTITIVKYTLRAIGNGIMWVYDKFVSIGSALGLVNPDVHTLETRFENIGNIVGKIAGLIAGVVISMKLWRMTLGPIFGMLRGMGGLAIWGKKKLIDGPMNFVKGGGIKQTVGKVARAPIHGMAHAMALDKLFPSIFNKNGTIKPLPITPGSSPSAENGYSQPYSMGKQGGSKMHQRLARATFGNPLGVQHAGTKGPMPSNLQSGAMIRTATNQPKGFKEAISRTLWGERLAITPNKNNPNMVSVGYQNPDGSKAQQFKKASDMKRYRSIGGGYRTNQGLLGGVNSMIQGGLQKGRDAKSAIGTFRQSRATARNQNMDYIYQNAGMGNRQQANAGKGFFGRTAQNIKARYQSAINTTSQALGRGPTGPKQTFMQRMTSMPRTYLQHLKNNKHNNLVTGGGMTKASVTQAHNQVIARDLQRNKGGHGGFMNSMPLFGRNADGSARAGRRAIGRVGTGVGNFGRATGNRLAAMGGAIKNNRVTQAIGRGGSAIGRGVMGGGRAIGNTITGKNTAGRIMHGTGRGAMAVGRGTMAVGKGMGRGAMAMGSMVGNTAMMGAKAGGGLLKGMGKVLFGGVGKIFGLAFKMLNWVGLAWFAWEIISMVWSNWDTIKEKALAAFNWIATSGVESLKNIWNWLQTDGVAILSQVWNWIAIDGVVLLGKMWDWWITSAVPKILQMWHWIATDGIKIVGNFFKWLISDGIPTAVAFGREFLGGMFQGSSDDGQSAFARFFEWLTTTILPTVFEYVGNIFSMLWGWIETDGMVQLGRLFTWLRDDAVPATLSFLGEAFSLIFNWIVTDGIAILGKLVTWIIGDAIPFLVVGATNLLLGLFKWIFTDGMVYFGKLVEWVVVDAIPGMVIGVGSLLGSMWDGMVDLGKKAFDKVRDWAMDKLNFTISIPKVLGGGSVSIGTRGFSFNGHTPVETDGSHRTGLTKVPYDGYVAKLHAGEMVLTRTQAQVIRGMGLKPDGSHRTGLYKVPYDGYLAKLHAGEMVLTRSEAQWVRAMMGSGSIKDIFAPTPTPQDPNTPNTPTPNGGGPSRPNPTPQSSGGGGPVSGGGNTTITFGANSVQVHVENVSDPKEIEKGAKQMFEQFKRLVEIENMRNYRPARR